MESTGGVPRLPCYGGTRRGVVIVKMQASMEFVMVVKCREDSQKTARMQRKGLEVTNTAVECFRAREWSNIEWRMHQTV